MTHHLHLHPEPFTLIKSGRKIIESRLNDEKRQTFKISDTLIFTNREDGSEIRTVIIALHHYSTFTELFSKHKPEKFGSDNSSELLKEMEIYYPKAEQDKYGVTGIEFKILEES